MSLDKLKLLLKWILILFLKPIPVLGALALMASVIFLIWKTPEWLLPDSLLENPSVTTSDSTRAVDSTSATPLNEIKLTLKNPKELLELRNEYRKTIYQMVAGVILLFGLYLTYRRITATERSVEVAQEGQITERFTRAVEQLGDEKIEIRLGGIYALERIARDSEKDHWTVMEILSAYVRKWTKIKKEPDKQEKTEPEKVNTTEKQSKPSTDIQAILTVIGRRKWIDIETNSIDLSYTNLRGANLSEAYLALADLTKANLSWAYLDHTNLNGANLNWANLNEAKFFKANLSKAQLFDAQLCGVDLNEANLSLANLRKSDLSSANLVGADLKETKLSRANLNGTDLRGANELTAAQLIKAINWQEATLDPDLRTEAERLMKLKNERD